MKNALKIFVSIVLLGSYIMTGCAKDNPMGGDPPGAASAHLYFIVGRVTEIVGKNLVLVDVLRENRDFQKEDIVAVKYDASRESVYGLDDLKEYEGKPVEVQIGDIVWVHYFVKEKRDIGEIKDCNYICPSGGYLDIIPKERYESKHKEFMLYASGEFIKLDNVFDVIYRNSHTVYSGDPEEG